MDFKEFMRGAMEKPEPGDKVEYMNLKGRVSGYILTNSQATVPSTGYFYEADVTEFWNEFREYKKGLDYELSFNTLMMRLLVEGLKVAPRLNAHLKFNLTSSAGRLTIKKHVDVAMPIILESGETFPVKVRHAEEKNLKELQAYIDDLIARSKTTDIDRVLFDLITQRVVGFILKGKIAPTIAQVVTGYVGKNKVAKLSGLFEKAPRDGTSLLMEELNEGSVCLTNWGSLDKDLVTGNVGCAPLLYPQVFLMGFGVVRDKEIVFRNEKGEVDFKTRKMLPINLSFDHRIGGFEDVMPLVVKLDEVFKNPAIIREW